MRVLQSLHASQEVRFREINGRRHGIYGKPYMDIGHTNQRSFQRVTLDEIQNFF